MFDSVLGCGGSNGLVGQRIVGSAVLRAVETLCGGRDLRSKMTFFLQYAILAIL